MMLKTKRTPIILFPLRKNTFSAFIHSMVRYRLLFLLKRKAKLLATYGILIRERTTTLNSPLWSVGSQRGTQHYAKGIHLNVMRTCGLFLKTAYSTGSDFRFYKSIRSATILILSFLSHLLTYLYSVPAVYRGSHPLQFKQIAIAEIGRNRTRNVPAMI